MGISFARRMSGVRLSAVRELLKLASVRDVISFGAGLPPSECLPAAELSIVTARIFAERGAEALQYSTTEGCPELRRAIARRMGARHRIDVSPDAILITSGSQQGLELTGKVFLDEGDIVFCESPTYLAALNAFRTWRPRMIEVPSDDDGMIVTELERHLGTCDVERTKFVYVVPDFQNPSGRTWSLARRSALLDLARRHQLLVVEDSPYSELRFEGEPVPSLKSLDRNGLVIYLSTFSKILSPGIRLGWVAAPPAILEKYVLAKQGTDLHTSTLAQLMVSTYLEMFDIDLLIAQVRDTCRARRDAMIAALEAHLPASVRFTRPSGGLFLWMELPGGMSAHDLQRRGLAHGVAFPPGDAFFANGGHENTLRLAYSDAPEARITEGIRRLGVAYREVAAELRGQQRDRSVLATAS